MILAHVLDRALDDTEIQLPRGSIDRLAERLDELLELDRVQRIEARRERAYRALRVEEGR